MLPNFGLKQIVKTTPEWAKWMFRITFAFTTCITLWIAATHLMTTEMKYEITLLLKIVIDPMVYTISKLFGVQDAEEPNLVNNN